MKGRNDNKHEEQADVRKGNGEEASSGKHPPAFWKAQQQPSFTYVCTSDGVDGRDEISHGGRSLVQRQDLRRPTQVS